ncbi:hypothetical protein Cgig2_024653 [Carnegiea gigantea]|uniref:Actin-related protein 3 n=1 Tax=Carnegiea gigantea TaxID=171969 RepID=A0A9Q1K8V2_9CARY|nr:hypothetical protein Cgig2_024653 [Carnegiea gigantea]
MGFAGNVEPCFILPTVVAVNDSFLNQPRTSNKSNWMTQYSAGVMADLDFFVGDEALSKSRSSSSYNLQYPIKNGQVENWDAMERFWQQCIFNYLRCDPEDHYFLLTESPLTPPESREYTGEIMFETFNVPGLYIAVQPVLALAAGYTTSKCELTGVVVDVGDGATHVVPVAEGYVIGSSIKSIPISGKDVTLFVQQLMRERGENVPPEDSFEVARQVKEMYCYTCSDIVKEFNKHDKDPSKYIKHWKGVKPKTGAPYSCDIGYERFLGPEVFFNPEIYNSDFTTPLPAVIDKCIQTAPIDTRRALYKNIVLSGGSTMFKDFHRRLQRDLKKIVDARVQASEARLGGEIKVSVSLVFVVHFCADGSLAPWRAHVLILPLVPTIGSQRSQPSHSEICSMVWRISACFNSRVLYVVASIDMHNPSRFKQACHTKAEYEEYGASICRTNPVFKGMY